MQSSIDSIEKPQPERIVTLLRGWLRGSGIKDRRDEGNRSGRGKPALQMTAKDARPVGINAVAATNANGC